ncbi:MAG: type I-C CRISPR-associated protein Cas8c/Csd1 [Anaerovorax sp.]
MSWIMKLYETYENCGDQAGKIGAEGSPVLLPIAHTTQQAQIEVTLDEDGNFTGATCLDKKEATTIIPCSEDSASKSGKFPVCHPLFDKLQYLAGDYEKFGGGKGGKFHLDYMEQLEKWCASTHANTKVCLVFSYLKKGTLIEDLVAAKVLFCDEHDKLLEKWNDGGEKPPIYKVLTGDSSDAFVRINVNIPGDYCKIWEDQQVYADYIAYYLSNTRASDLCYASGETILCSDKHPSKIRNSGDKTKLISANDISGFTFRGRFMDKNQALSLGYDVSQKAHNALKWLISKQGYYIDGEVILAFATGNQNLPSMLGDTSDLFDYSDHEEQGDPTNQEFSQRLNKAMAGYGRDLDQATDIVIMGVDAATPGRLSITFYREMKGDQFIERIKNWHEKCAWLHTYRIGADKKRIPFVGAPAPKDIAFAAYGNTASDKLKKSTVERLLPCIVDGRPLPLDLVRNVVQRAGSPMSMENWEWVKTLSIACNLYWKRNEKEIETMALDESKLDRSYLYGRLLAIADQIENMAYDKWGERPTNAMRYMNTFSQKPRRTWKIIAESLRPYQDRLVGKIKYYNDLLVEIGSMLDGVDCEEDKALEGTYLFGYYSQTQEFRDRTKAIKEMKEKKNSDNEE